MKCKNDVVLIIDTNILLDIIIDNYDKNIKEVINKWIIKLKKNSQGFKNRHFVLVYTSEIQCEYLNIMSQKGFKKLNNGIRALLEQGSYQLFPISYKNLKCYFNFYKVQVEHLTRKNIGKFRDWDDFKFVEILTHIAKMDVWNNRTIIYASKDHSIEDIQRVMNTNILSFATSLSELQVILSTR